MFPFRTGDVHSHLLNRDVRIMEVARQGKTRPSVLLAPIAPPAHVGLSGNQTYGQAGSASALCPISMSSSEGRIIIIIINDNNNNNNKLKSPVHLFLCCL